MIENFKKIHFTGIKGVGMTALAICAKNMGIEVTGSDIGEVFVTDETLTKAGIEWTRGIDAKNVKGDEDLLITTGAHGGLNNVEAMEAKKRGIKVITQGEAMALFSKGKKLISVCGVGGKTTTSSIIACVLDVVGADPSYAIGVGEIFPTGLPGSYKESGEYFVCEADEFVVSPGIDNTPKFLLLNPFVTVVTNIEHDHPDVYETFEDTKKAYSEFLGKTTTDGVVVAFADNKNTMDVVGKLKNKKIITYGRSEGVDFQIVGETLDGTKTLVEVLNNGKSFKFTSHFPGEYNTENMVASFAALSQLGFSSEEIIRGLEMFRGVKRRFEILGGISSGALLVDDYAHHPNEIKAVLKLAKSVYPDKRIVCVFQPHTYSRTKVLFDEFTKSFKNSDLAVFVDIYSSAREEKDESVSMEKLADKVGGKYIGALEALGKWIEDNTNSDDVVLTLGAGDIFHVHEGLLKK